MLRSGSDIATSFAVAALMIALGAALYMYFVRPHLAGKGYLDFEQGLWDRLKNRWDVVLLAAVNLLAASWNSLLDLAVALLTAWPDISGSLSTIDLTPAWMPESVRWFIQTGSVLLSVARIIYQASKRPEP